MWQIKAHEITELKRKVLYTTNLSIGHSFISALSNKTATAKSTKQYSKSLSLTKRKLYDFHDESQVGDANRRSIATEMFQTRGQAQTPPFRFVVWTCLKSYNKLYNILMIFVYRLLRICCAACCTTNLQEIEASVV